MNKSKIFDKLIILFIIFSPILDLLSSIQDKYLNIPVQISAIIRCIFLVFIFVYIFRNKDNRKLLILFLVYTLLAISSFFTRKLGLYTEILNLFRIFHLPIMMIFFSKYNNKKIDDKFILKIYMLYILVFILMHIFKLDKNYLNIISAVIVGILPITLNYVLKAKSYILKVLFTILLGLCVYFVSTKLIVIGTLIVSICVFISHYRLEFIYNNYKRRLKIILIFIIFISLFVVLVRFAPFYLNIKKEIIDLNIHKLKDVYSFRTIDTLLFSGSLTNIKNIINTFVKGGYDSIVYGIGKTKLGNYTNIDFMDMLLTVGVFGIIIYFIMFNMVHRKTELKKIYYMSYIVFLVISIFFGHVFMYPSVSLLIALLYIVSSNSIKIEKKKILLVSNMYPSKKYEYYGVYVKNIKEILDKKYDVEIVVVHKEENIIKKLFAYINLYLGVLLKGIFNNYDYLYVHFVSSSSFGAVYTKLTSKDVKLVLNAHCNDVIDDQTIDLKNIKKSRRYIKHADKVVVPSEYFKNVIVDNYKYDPEKIVIYPSGGVDTSLFTDLDKEECIEKLNLNNKYKYVGFASRIEKSKGYDIYLRFIKELEKDKLIGNYRFILIGTGSEEDKLNNLIKELSLEKYVEVRSMLGVEELLYFYNAIDVFVFPTYRRSESLGLVGLEAMSCGCFVISSDNYGPSSYVKNNKNGFTFKSKDPIDLKNRFIEYTKLNEEKLNKIISKAKTTAKEYDSKATEKIILDVFE